jgi:hypothetical protein
MRILALPIALLCGASLFGADIAGKWSVTAVDPDGRQHKSELTVREVAGKLEGVVATADRNIPIREPKLEGDDFSFKMPWGDMTLTIKVKVNGNKLAGTFTTDSGDSGPVTAERVAAAAAAGDGVTGKWKLVALRANGSEMRVELEIKEAAGKLSAVLSSDAGAMPADEVQFAGNTLTLKLSSNNGPIQIKLEKSGESLKGNYTTPEGSTGVITGSR